MSSGHYPVLWVGKVAVITAPAEIDVTNADDICERLLSVLGKGPAALVVDMTATTFCDSAGVNGLVRAFRQAAASGAEMRLVTTAATVTRVLSITGVDRLIHTYPTVPASLAGWPAVSRGPDQPEDNRARS